MNTNIPQLNTSTDAFYDLKPGRVRWCVLELIAEYAGQRGLTHDDIERLYMRGVSRDRYRLATDSGIRARTSELVRAGLVERVPDDYGRSRTGRKAALWRLTPTAQLADALPPGIKVPHHLDDPTTENTGHPHRAGDGSTSTESERTQHATTQPNRDSAKPTHYCDGQQELFDAAEATQPVDNSR